MWLGSGVVTLIVLTGTVVPATSQPIVRVRTELVVLHVSVTGRQDHPVTDLPCEAFIVYEDNRPQDVSFCQSGREPLVLGLVIDGSTSMMPYRNLVAMAGEAFLGLGNPANDIFVLRFNEHVDSALVRSAFTQDPADVARAVRTMPMRGMTALHDAIDASIQWAGKSDRLKKVVVLMADGGDNASGLEFDEALRRALGANVSFFSIAISDGLNTDANPDKLRRLARETGGLVFTPRNDRGVHQAFERIAEDLQSGYTLAYVSNDANARGKYRAIRVSVRAPDGTKLSIRTRAGYMASGESDEPSR
jgi:VWFA-related protein